MKQRLNCNFTLIELLMIVAIIAVLITMLLPALKRAKDYTKHIHCSGSLKQVGLALMTYANDYDSRIPQPSGYDPSHAPPWQGPQKRWTGLVNPYLNYDSNWRLPPEMRCPFDIEATSAYWYGLNPYNTKMRWNRIPKPSQSLMVGDTGAHWGESSSFYLICNRWRQLYIYRHFSTSAFQGRFNSICADLHVETFVWGDGRITRPHDQCNWFNTK